MKNNLKISKKHVFFLRRIVFLRKKSPRQGCTTQITELGMHQNHNFHENQLKINKNPKINPPSTITIPESVFRCLVSFRCLLYKALVNTGRFCGSCANRCRRFLATGLTLHRVTRAPLFFPYEEDWTTLALPIQV